VAHYAENERIAKLSLSGFAEAHQAAKDYAIHNYSGA